MIYDNRFVFCVTVLYLSFSQNGRQLPQASVGVIFRCQAESMREDDLDASLRGAGVGLVKQLDAVSWVKQLDGVSWRKSSWHR